MATSFQSRWGFHPCSYEFYLKLKELNILAQKALRQMSTHKRWDRKQPQNRRRFVGGKNGWEVNTAVGGQFDGIPTQKKRDIPKMHRVYEPMPEPAYPPIDTYSIELIAADYKNARTPVVESQVRPLRFSEQHIDSLLKTLREFNSRSETPVVEQPPVG